MRPRPCLPPARAGAGPCGGSAWPYASLPSAFAETATDLAGASSWAGGLATGAIDGSALFARRRPAHHDMPITPRELSHLADLAQERGFGPRDALRLSRAVEQGAP